MSAGGWTDRVAALWNECDVLEPDVFLARMQALVTERPDDDAVARYELAGAYDSLGREAEAVSEYERAFDLGLPDEVLRPATIQYASTLRNVGRSREAVSLLEAERVRASDALDEALTIFLAFALVDAGEPVRAVGEIAAALGAHLPRYQRSVAKYARELLRRD